MIFFIFFTVLFISLPACADPVTTAIAISLAGGGFAVPTALTFAVSKFLVSTAISVAFNFIAGALTKQDRPDQGSFASIKSNGSTQQFRQAVTERRGVYGEQRVSGPIVFPSVSENNKYLHFVLVLASHEVEEIGEIIIDEESITDDMLNGSGVVTSGFYANVVRIKKYLGTPDQTADPDLVSEVAEWTANHRLRQCAYVYVRYTWNRDKFPTGIPSLSAWVKGKKVYDPRDDTVKWTPNAALMTRDYLTDARLGLATDESFIDDDQTIASANTSEEYITTQNLDVSITGVNTTSNLLRLEGDRNKLQTGDKVRLISGTIGGLAADTDYYVIVYQRKTTPRIALAPSLEDALSDTRISLTSGSSGTLRKIAEPRYFGGGVFKTSAERGENLQEIISAMAGQAVYSGGSWRILAGQYQTPTIYFDEDDVVGNIKVSTRVSKTDRFNRVQGTYISPLNDGNPADYPLVSNSTYTLEDGEELKRNLNLAYTQRPHTAQRIAKIALERMRQEIIFEAAFNLTGMKVQVGDNFYFTFDRYGWDEKIFEVIDWRLGVENDAPVILIKARENAASVYDWNNGEETAVDPAQNTNLPNPFNVPVASGFSLDSILIETQGEDRIFNVLASWETPDDPFISSGGRFELVYKRTTESTFESAGFADGSETKKIINVLEKDVTYDIGLYQYNSLSVKSNISLIENFIVGTSVTTNTEDWENETLAAEDWENDTLASEDWNA